MKLELWTAMDPSPHRVARFSEWAEETGWDGIALYDSQNLDGDCYVGLALAATATQHLGLSTGVTNPLTRHPAVAASAIASIQQASGGRAVFGIARGDSALAYVGHAPVHIEVFERYLQVVQTYLKGEAVSFDDLTYWQQMAPRVETLQLADTPKDSRLIWLTSEDKKVPVEVVATGPKAIAAASRHADQVMFALGADTERVKWGLEEARSARREAGLDPNGIKFGVYLNVVCHPNLDVARELLSELDTFARFSVMHGKTFGPVSRGEQEVFTALHRFYDMHDDSTDRFSLPNEFADRFAIVGPPDTCIRRIKELADLGIEKVVVIGPKVEDRTGEAARAAELMAREVLPAF